MYHDQAIQHLSKDKKMRQLISSIDQSQMHHIQPDRQVREHLISSIVSQQLSVKVAKVIHLRFCDLFGGAVPGSNDILDKDISEFRACGLSGQKAQYIQNIARFFEDENIKNEHFHDLPDEEIIRILTQIKGVGKWTVEMVLIFCLARPDVFALDDFGIMSSIKQLYNLQLEGKELKIKVLHIAEKWKPFRSTACLYLWAFKDVK
ncbi:MAG: DNA-3-methyladenine glycosylase 2 family protein [Bacteroidota bacterium]|nr:DNA-3-methyladenine glycosylase 2 family protein [Bacteroidota bacterium]